MAANSLQNVSANSGVLLGYGTVRQKRWRRIAAILILIVLVPPGFWWSRSMLQQWSEDRARRAEIRYQVTTNLADASARIKRGQWANAQLAVDRAQLASEADPLLFDAEELRALRQRIDETENAMHAAGASPRDCSRANVTICISTNIIADLNQTADRLLQEGRYAEALQTLRQVLILDPNNAHAQARFPDALLERSSSDNLSDDESP